jgi:hypothetical protein
MDMDPFKPWAAQRNATAPPDIPAKLAPAFTPDQLRRLERLRNRSTLYEIEIVRGDGTRALLCYGQKNKRQIMVAIEKRGDSVLAFLGVDSAQMDRTRGTTEVRMGDAIARPTGRTQRDAITSGDELPYVGTLHPPAKDQPGEVT